MGNDRAFGGLRAESQENLVTQSWEVRRTVKKASCVSETRSETDCVTPGLELIAALDTLCDHLIMGLRWSWQEKLDIIWDLILWPLISSRFLILDLLESFESIYHGWSMHDWVRGRILSYTLTNNEDEDIKLQDHLLHHERCVQCTGNAMRGLVRGGIYPFIHIDQQWWHQSKAHLLHPETFVKTVQQHAF